MLQTCGMYRDDDVKCDAGAGNVQRPADRRHDAAADTVESSITWYLWSPRVVTLEAKCLMAAKHVYPSDYDMCTLDDLCFLW